MFLRQAGEALGEKQQAAADFAARYQPHAAAVLRLCRRMLASAQDAEDARNESALRAQQALHSYDAAQPFRAWLLGIAAHYCLDKLRRAAREQQLFAPAELESLNLPAQGPDPLQALMARERADALRAALLALPARFRAVLALRYFAEWRYAEIAAALNIRPDQVGVLLHRAKLRLREAFAPEETQ